MEQIGKEKRRTESVNFREKERINQILGENILYGKDDFQFRDRIYFSRMYAFKKCFINLKVISLFLSCDFFAVSSKKPFSFLFFKICVPLAYVPADCCLLTLSFSKFYIFILSPIFFWDFLEFLALKIF